MLRLPRLFCSGFWLEEMVFVRPDVDLMIEDTGREKASEGGSEGGSKGFAYHVVGT